MEIAIGTFIVFYILLQVNENQNKLEIDTVTSQHRWYKNTGWVVIARMMRNNSPSYDSNYESRTYDS